ncbi:MAG: hypothetical protein LC722_06425 [Actinobacteria bacterium]|nr:hypothetical protein [Actinomycetota bacterium]
MNRLTRWLGTWPGRLESAGQVKRRLLVVSVIAALAVGGAFAVTQYGSARGPFTQAELQDMSGLPLPPVRFVQDADGTYRELSPEELQQLQELQRLIQNFPAPQNLGGGFLGPDRPAPASSDGANVDPPSQGGN